MRSALHPAFAAAVLAVVSLGASCDRSNPQTTPTEETPRGDRIDQLQGVDVSELTSDERELWVSVVNDLLSPCGEPVTVARCVSESRSCRQCVPAAKYLARLVTGYERRDIERFYAARFSREHAVELPIDHAPIRGAPMANVTIVELSDFECPHCAAANPILHRVLAENQGQVRLAFLHYPLTELHERALPAARAAVAAQNQGKFWEMCDLLFEHQDSLEDTDLEQYATEIGLDLTRFRTDLEAAETETRIEADREAGREAGVRSTPTLFINGRQFEEPLGSLPMYIQEEIEM